VFLIVALVFVAAIVVQVYFAGLMLFGEEGGRELHVETGYILGTAGALFLFVPALARAGRTAIILGIILALLTFFQPYLTFAREESPFIAALHPVIALVIVALSLVLTRRALSLVRSDSGSVSASP
jgi:mercuric ion transport protein